MDGVPYFVTLDEALALIHQHPMKLDVERVPLDEAHGRHLSEDLPSLVNDPAFDNSAMDGFACQHDPDAIYPLTLGLAGTVAAAKADDNLVVGPGQAVRIMTGAPMPPGTSAMLPIERCEIDEAAGTVTLLEAPKPHFVRKQGENLQAGSVALRHGAHMTPARVGLCATMGYETVPVWQRARVAIVSTGDELVPPGTELAPGEIYESNSYGLAGLVAWAGHTPVRFSAVSDTEDALREALDEAASTCDLVLTSGGVSMGEFDFVRALMEREGDMKFWRVKIRPGSPPLFGTWGGTPLFGLPGNPVSSHVVFRLLVAPFLRRATGADGPVEWRVRAQLRDRVKSTNDCLTLRRVTLTSTPEGLMAHQPRHQGSGNLESLASADALTLLQPGQSGEVGEWIDVMVLQA